MADPTLEDEDTLEGFQTYLKSVGDLVAAIPGGVYRGRLKKGADEPSGRANSIQCYASIACEAGPRQKEWLTQGYKDFRKVTITCYGLKADVVRAAKLLRKYFDRQPYPTSGVPVLKIPNATLCGCMEIDQSARLEQDPAGKKGYDVWQGVVAFEVLTGRRVP